MARTPWAITQEMFLSLDEVERLLAHVRGRAEEAGRSGFLDRLIVEVMLFSGLRNSEFCRLRLGDTILGADEAMLTVAGSAGVEGEGRTVHLPSGIGQLLVEYTSQIRLQMLPQGVRADDREQPLVFHERRRPFERTGLYRRVVRILTAAGLGERASVQLLRHTYGYLAYLRTGGNLLFVQRQLGHAHPMVTSIYAQFVDEPYGELAERVGGGGGGYTSMALEPLERRVVNTVEEFNSECD